jgi:hypothetical protein
LTATVDRRSKEDGGSNMYRFGKMVIAEAESEVRGNTAERRLTLRKSLGNPEENFREELESRRKESVVKCQILMEQIQHLGILNLELQDVVFQNGKTARFCVITPVFSRFCP